jgi:prepilin-type N-terminal cleavage/methylation domain-containing protein/prepilin-type processing-associated H-X9-DG protein
MYSRARQHRGFTLIELLVVIAIISILASILFPVFARARAKGRQAACISNQYQICLALNMYSQDADEIFPPGADWYQSVYGYMRNRDILFCPDRKDKAPGYGMNYAASGLSIGSFWDPAKKVLIGDVRPELLGITAAGYTHNPPEWWINRPGGAPAAGDNSWRGNNIPERHNDGTVYGYADGHVKWSREMAIDDPLFWDPTVVSP